MYKIIKRNLEYGMSPVTQGLGSKSSKPSCFLLVETEAQPT